MQKSEDAQGSTGCLFGRTVKTRPGKRIGESFVLVVWLGDRGDEFLHVEGAD